jgi:hypothetical protein
LEAAKSGLETIIEDVRVLEVQRMSIDDERVYNLRVAARPRKNQ